MAAGVLAALDLCAEPLAAMPPLPTRELTLARIAILHTWLFTQQEGWLRLAFTDLGLPYAYISTQQVVGEGDLWAKYDVIVFPPADVSPQEIVDDLPFEAATGVEEDCPHAQLGRGLD